MAPRLAGGRPVDQRKQALPQVSFLCRCSSCILHTSIDPQTKQAIQGRYVGRPEFKEHKNQDEKARKACSILTGLAPPGDFSVPVPAPPGPVAAEGTDETALIQTLQHMQKIAKGRCVKDVIPDPQLLQFSEPPSCKSHPLLDSSTIPGLDRSSIPNSNALECLDWLSRSLTDCQEMPIKSCSTHLKLLRKVLIGHIESEIASMNEILKSEWERQRRVAVAAGEHVLDTGAPLVLDSLPQP